MQRSSRDVEAMSRAVRPVNARDLHDHLAAFSDDCRRRMPGIPDSSTRDEPRTAR
jgi:hypothetical protein